MGMTPLYIHHDSRARSLGHPTSDGSSVAPDAAGCDDLIAIRTKLHLEADMANRIPATVGWKNGGFNGTNMIYIYIYIHIHCPTPATRNGLGNVIRG